MADFQTAGSVDYSTGTSLSPGAPASVASGDLLLLGVHVLDPNTTRAEHTPGTPTGWTKLGQQHHFFNQGGLHVYYREADGTATDTPTLTMTTAPATGWRGGMVRIDGQAASPIDVSAFTDDDSAPVTHAAVTSSAADSLAVIIGGNILTETGTFTFGNSFTGRIEYAGGNEAFWVATKAVGSGSIGDTDVTMSTILSRSGLCTLVVAPGATGTDIDASLESISLTTFGATVFADTEIAAALEAINLTTFQSSISGDTQIDAALESISLTPFSSTVLLDVDVSAALESITITPNSAAIALDVGVDAALESITVTEHKATIDTEVQAGLESLSVSTFAAAISGDTTISAALESITLQGNQANVQLGSAITAGLESLLLYTNSATVSLDIDISSALESLILTTLSAQVGLSTDVDAGIESIQITANGSTISLDTGVEVTLEALTLTAFKASISLPTVVFTKPGLEFTMPENRLHFSMSENRLHYSMPTNRLHFNLSDEDN